MDQVAPAIASYPLHCPYRSHYSVNYIDLDTLLFPPQTSLTYSLFHVPNYSISQILVFSLIVFSNTFFSGSSYSCPLPLLEVHPPMSSLHKLYFVDHLDRCLFLPWDRKIVTTGWLWLPLMADSWVIIYQTLVCCGELIFQSDCTMCSVVPVMC